MPSPRAGFSGSLYQPENKRKYVMSHLFRAALLGTALSLFATAAYAATDLPLKRVVVTSSGLALYEHAGQVTGDADIELPVRLDRVDDMLKSLVVLDAKGSLGGVSLPGREPLSQTFRGLPFSQFDLENLVQLLNTLRGAAVETENISGRLMNVVPETEETEHGTITRHRISILTTEGIKTVVLEDLSHLKFTDKTVQEQLNRALEAVFTNRIKDQRSLTVSLRGDGARTVGLAYIQDAPLWKSSYRLVLPEEGGDKAVLQGWAVLENTTGIDWDGVAVTLMSGSPVTYKQALYESYYLPRPELPVKVMDRVMPRVDQGTVATAERDELSRRAGMEFKEEAPARHRLAKSIAPAAPMAAMEMMAADTAMPMPGVAGMAYGGGAAAYNAAPAQMAAATTTAAAAETASQMVFAFPQPVDLPAGHSLMVPFVSRSLPAEKLWVYQPETNAQHPLASVSVKNETGSGLPPGILTLYDSTDRGMLHVGDADMPLVPKGEDRFISFALDTKTKIDQQVQEDRRLGVIRITKGTLYQKVLWRNTTTYTVKGPEDEERLIVIEHPRRPEWDLIAPEGIEGEPETTATHHRLRVRVPAGKNKTLTVTLQNEGEEGIGRLYASPEDITARIAAVGKDMPGDLRRALEKIAGLRGTVFSLEQKIYAIENERQRIYNDQQRLRENINTVSTNNNMGKRYLQNLEEQENRLDQLVKEEAATRAAMDKAQRELQDYIAGLEL